MNLLQMLAEIFIKQSKQSGGSMDFGVVLEALKGLLPTKNGELDLAGLVAQLLQQDGLAAIARSWLSNGANDGISVEQLLNVLGEGPLREFASKVGLNTDTAVSQLSKILPQMIDQQSQDGQLLENPALDLAKGILEKWF